MLDPDNSLRSLRAKLKEGKSWHGNHSGQPAPEALGPVSSDRIVWAMAAWEIYKVTGDKSMLDQAIRAIENTLNDDMRVVWDDTYKLMHGEQSYLDWREADLPQMDAT